MTLTRAKQNREVAGSNRPVDAGLPIADQNLFANQPRDLCRGRARTGLEGVAGKDAQDIGLVVHGLIYRKAILFFVHERVASIGKLGNRVTQIVDERQQRRHGSETA